MHPILLLVVLLLASSNTPQLAQAPSLERTLPTTVVETTVSARPAFKLIGIDTRAIILFYFRKLTLAQTLIIASEIGVDFRFYKNIFYFKEFYIFEPFKLDQMETSKVIKKSVHPEQHYIE